MREKASLSFDEMLEIYNTCDSSYDGVFYTAVKTTRIYCRPSCKSRRPNKENVTFYQTAKQAENAGFRPCKRCQPDKIDFNPKMDLVSNTKSYIKQNYKEKLTLEDIAGNVASSPFYLERLFKEMVLDTPRGYLEKVRVEQAECLLKTTNMSNIDICFEVGFQSPSSFYNAFRRLKRCSPKQFRKEVST